MAKNSRVGSLYYEIILDPNKFAKGATRVTAEQKKMANIIKREQKAVEKSMTNKDRLEREKKFIREMVMARKISVQQGIQLTRMAKVEYIRQEKMRTKALLIEISKRRKLRGMEFMPRRPIPAKTVGPAVAMANPENIRAYKEMGGVLGEMTSELGRLTMKLFPLFVGFQLFKKNLHAIFGTLVSFTKAADKKATALRTLTSLYSGNEKVARGLRRELEQYSQRTAFSVDDTMALAVQLRALGFNAKETVTSIKQFGRLSFGDPAKMKLIAKAYSDVKAQGKLMATEVRQFANQGVPLLLQLQRQMGLSAQQVKDQMKAGMIGFGEVEKAVEAIAERFGAIDEAGLQTFTGQMEAAGEAAERLKASIAEISGINDDMKVMAVLLNKMLDALNESAGKAEDNKFSALKIALDSMRGIANSAIRTLPVIKDIAFFYDNTIGPAVSAYAARMKEAADQEEKAANLAKMRAEQEQRAAEAITKADQRAEDQAKKAEEFAKKRMEMLELQMAKRKALETGDNSELERLEKKFEFQKMELEMIEKYGESAGRRIAQEERELQILEEKAEQQKKIAEQQKKLKDMDNKEVDRRKKQFDDALNIKLPAEMKQNSVEEWVYLKEKRDREKREANEERRHQDKIKADRDNVQAIIDGLQPTGQPQPQVNLV